jgi:hypothetical protein
MELQKYIGYKFEDVKMILDENNIHYKIIETFDTKQTKMGDEVRIVNIKCNQNSSFSTENFEHNGNESESYKESSIEIYVAYF